MEAFALVLENTLRSRWYPCFSAVMRYLPSGRLLSDTGVVPANLPLIKIVLRGGSDVMANRAGPSALVSSGPMTASISQKDRVCKFWGLGVWEYKFRYPHQFP